MTRANFFKRVMGLFGLGALAATVKPAIARPNKHNLTVRDWNSNNNEGGYLTATLSDGGV